MSKAIITFCGDSKEKNASDMHKDWVSIWCDEARKKIYGEIEKLENLRITNKLKAITMITNDIGKMDAFFSLPNEFKGKWVSLLLRGEL